MEREEKKKDAGVDVQGSLEDSVQCRMKWRVEKVENNYTLDLRAEKRNKTLRLE